ncbi:MAG: DUF4097 family beta strand repeat protein [Spirochaetaceae bacterium]|nr:MAG: DUF4097 family beta strand repeat protein [Spirochaetaceae bacterium]
MNRNLKKIVFITAAVAVVSLGLAAILFFATNVGRAWGLKGGIPVDERRTFFVEGIGDISIRTGSTDVFVGKNEGSSVEIHLYGTVYSAQPEAIPALNAEQNGGLLTITTGRKDGRPFVLGFFSSDLILEIRIPERYRDALLVHTSSGDVEIDDQQLSKLSVETSSGDIQLRSIQAGTITLGSSSGDQRVENLLAEHSELTSSSGEIRVKGLEGGAKAESSSGDITLHYQVFNSDLEVRSSSGDVGLFLTETAEFRLEARASSGDVDCAFPVTLAEASGEVRRNRLRGIVGDGTHQVVVQTSSGDITIRP